MALPKTEIRYKISTTKIGADGIERVTNWQLIELIHISLGVPNHILRGIPKTFPILNFDDIVTPITRRFTILDL